MNKSIETKHLFRGIPNKRIDAKELPSGNIKLLVNAKQLLDSIPDIGITDCS